jgi:hypothetical protein
MSRIGVETETPRNVVTNDFDDLGRSRLGICGVDEPDIRILAARCGNSGISPRLMLWASPRMRLSAACRDTAVGRARIGGGHG